MYKTITELGPKEAEFLSVVASSYGGEFTSEIARHFWGTSALTKKKLHLLENRGWIARIEKGKYTLIPLEAGPERHWSQDTYLVAAALVQPAAIAYWSAIRHWDWTEQIPRIVFVQTTKRKMRARRNVLGVEYEFVTVDQSRFYGHVKEWRNGKPILITEKEKTLVDCADDVKRAGGIEELAKAIKAGAREISWQKLDQYARKFPNRAVLKRLGYLLETLVPELPSPAASMLEVWRNDLSAGIALLQPGGKVSGRISTRWRVKSNAEVG